MSDPSVGREHVKLALDDAGLWAEGMRNAMLVMRADRVLPVGSDPVRLRAADVLVLGAVHLRVDAGPGHSGGLSAARPLPASFHLPPEGTEGPSSATSPPHAWRWAMALSPLAVSVCLALVLSSPMPLVFGLTALLSAVPLLSGARRGERERRRHARVSAKEAAERRSAAAPSLPDALAGDCAAFLPETVSFLDRDAGESESEWVLDALAPSEGKPHIQRRSEGAEVLIRCGTVLVLPRSPGGTPDPGQRDVDSSSIPAPALPIALRLWPRRPGAQPLPAGSRHCPDPGISYEVRFGSRDPAATVRLLLLSRAARPGLGPVLSVHESSVPVEAAGLPGVVFSPGPDAVHVCERSTCRWACLSRIRVERAGPANSLNGRLWCADGISVNGFRKTAAGLASMRTGEAEASVVPERPPGPASPVLALDSLGSPWRPESHGESGLQALGPHVFAVGTTGSGKTELIRTLIVSALLERPRVPWRLFLIDFKGGSGLSAFAGLPGVEDVVSDLDGGSVHRVLVSLAAEVRRREAWLAEHGWPDLESAWAARSPTAEAAPPQLLIVVDELQAFTESVEGAPEALARIAALGRSLGIRLLLASQRASGALSPALRANVASVLVLRPAAPLEAGEFLDGPLRSDSLAWSAGSFAVVSHGSVSGPYHARTWHQLAAPEPSCRPWGGDETERPAAARPGPDHRTEVQAGAALASLREALRRKHREVREHSASLWPRCVAPELPRSNDDALPPPPDADPVGLVDDPLNQRVLRLEGPDAHALLAGQPGHGMEDALLALARGRTAPGREGDAGMLCLLFGERSPLAELTERAHGWCSTKNPGDVLEFLAWVPEPEHGMTLVIESLDLVVDLVRRWGRDDLEQRLAAWTARAASCGALLLASCLREPGRLSSALASRAWFPAAVASETLRSWPRPCQRVQPLPGRALLTGPWRCTHAHRQAETSAAGRSGPEDSALLDASHEAQFMTSSPASPAPVSAVLPRGDGARSSPQPRFAPLRSWTKRPADQNLTAASPGGPLHLGFTAEGAPVSLELGTEAVLAVLAEDKAVRAAAVEGIAARHPTLRAAAWSPEDGLEALDGLLRDGEGPWVIGLPSRVPPALGARLWRRSQEPLGLVLGPCRPSDGDLLGARLPLSAAADPDASWLVQHGRATRFALLDVMEEDGPQGQASSLNARSRTASEEAGRQGPGKGAVHAAEPEEAP
ncbi:FtsK/SpoIIIE domain-containing protein [Arthrobacter sp. UM1]|uniref:FtsK/SpoIIIE domain-containing protein n=1 Tax=Arthrobacter sp. UM1 TaxID=2766776 RepID=UPI001CF6BC6A|nr:FtsK/SpoIIIE domain-containing protein [Arthrobacter sp. UM1]MCB4207768.1 hypothetical protein [Arthrobacter sp. UM1]